MFTQNTIFNIARCVVIASYTNWLEEGPSLKTSIVTQVAKGPVTFVMGSSSRCDLVNAI